MRYAIINSATGEVENVILWDGKIQVEDDYILDMDSPNPIIENEKGVHIQIDESAWSPPPGCTAVPCPDEVSPGWRWTGKTFARPVVKT